MEIFINDFSYLTIGDKFNLYIINNKLSDDYGIAFYVDDSSINSTSFFIDQKYELPAETEIGRIYIEKFVRNNGLIKKYISKNEMDNFINPIEDFDHSVKIGFDPTGMLRVAKEGEEYIFDFNEYRSLPISEVKVIALNKCNF